MKAEEFLIRRGCQIMKCNDKDPDYFEDVQPIDLIEFAKMHVEAALKEASEKARVQMGEIYMREQITIHPHSLVDTVIITADTESILNSYSLDNIK